MINDLFKYQTNPFLWINRSDEAKAILNSEQLTLLNDISVEMLDEMSFSTSLQNIILWNDYTITIRMLKWLEGLYKFRMFDITIFNRLVDTVLWAFENYRFIHKQTEEQFRISLSYVKQLFVANSRIHTASTMRSILISIFILTERPDLQVRSFKKILGENKSFWETDGNQLFHQIFYEDEVLVLMSDHLEHIVDWEIDVLIKLREGQSLRKILPRKIVISQRENGLLHAMKIDMIGFKDHILERYIIAARLLKEDPDQISILNQLIHSSKAFRDDFVTFKNDIKFWQSVFRVLSKENGGFELRTTRNLVDYFEFKRYYDIEPLTYSLKGRTMKSIIADQNQYHQLGEVPTAKTISKTWKGIGLDKFVTKKGENTYIIEEITDAKRLFKEGRCLKHCVFSYLRSILYGSSHIFSLSIMKNNKVFPFYTLELDRSNNLVQIAGRENCRANNKIISLLEEWSAQNQMNLYPYLDEMKIVDPIVFIHLIV